MKKRIFAILLALTLVLCVLPVFAAAEETEPKLFVFADSHLRNMNYTDYETRTELAVGDSLYIIYEDTQPADVLIDGKTVCSFEANEYQGYQYDVKQTGSFNLTIRSGEQTRFSRTYTVMSSAEMYRKTLGPDLKDATAEPSLFWRSHSRGSCRSRTAGSPRATRATSPRPFAARRRRPPCLREG